MADFENPQPVDFAAKHFEYCDISHFPNKQRYYGCLFVNLLGTYGPIDFKGAITRFYPSSHHVRFQLCDRNNLPDGIEEIVDHTTNAEKDTKNPMAVVVRKTLVATARSCMDHTNATENDLEYLRGDPPYPEKAACIIKCLLEKVGVVRNNKYSKTSFMTAVTPLVFRNKKKMEHMKTVSENCDKEVNHETVSPCDLGNEIIACIFKYAPELHFKS